MNNKKNDNKIKKPMIAYYLVAIVAILLLQYFVTPMFTQSKDMIKEVDYSTFMKKLKNGEINNVDVSDKKVSYTLKADIVKDSGDATAKETPKIIYEAARMEDLKLIDRLEAQLDKEDIAFKRVYPVELNPVVATILNLGITILMFVAVGQLLTRMMTKRMGDGGGALSFGKSNVKIYDQSIEGVTFENVAGQDEAKEALEEIVDFLHNPKKYTEIGAKLPKGALLVGPPGTGKTLLAQAVAGEAKVPFFSISGSEFVEMFVGLGASKVRDLFKQANEKAPCIVFIDEIDTIGKKRDAAGFSGNDEREQTLNQLLAEMDGFEGKSGVVILAATNRPESLDPALLRPGRFDRRIPVELPDLAGREAILKVHAKRIRKEPDIDYNAIARATAGASGADLANMINEGALRAVRQGRKTMAQGDLEESVEVILAGYERKNAVISPREKEIVAYHEVGHAIVAASQTHAAPLHKITIIPRTSGALGYIMQVDEEEKVLMSKEEAFSRIVTATGGRSAEELIFNTKTSGASNDIEQATKVARAMVTRFGMSDTFGMVAMETVTNQYLGGDTSLSVSPDTAYQIDQEVNRIIERAHEKAISILKENIDALHKIARYLLTKETMTGEEFMEMLESSQ